MINFHRSVGPSFIRSTSATSSSRSLFFLRSCVPDVVSSSSFTRDQRNLISFFYMLMMGSVIKRTETLNLCSLANYLFPILSTNLSKRIKRRKKKKVQKKKNSSTHHQSLETRPLIKSFKCKLASTIRACLKS